MSDFLPRLSGFQKAMSRLVDIITCPFWSRRELASIAIDKLLGIGTCATHGCCHVGGDTPPSISRVRELGRIGTRQVHDPLPCLGDFFFGKQARRTRASTYSENWDQTLFLREAREARDGVGRYLLGYFTADISYLLSVDGKQPIHCLR